MLSTRLLTMLQPPVYLMQDGTAASAPSSHRPGERPAAPTRAHVLPSGTDRGTSLGTHCHRRIPAGTAHHGAGDRHGIRGEPGAGARGAATAGAGWPGHHTAAA